jgi:hypothetical protein
MEFIGSILCTFKRKGYNNNSKPTIVFALHRFLLTQGVPMLYRVHFYERFSIRCPYRHMSTNADRAISITTVLISIFLNAVVTAMEERKNFASIEDVKDNASATLKKVLHEAISSNNLKVT